MRSIVNAQPSLGRAALRQGFTLVELLVVISIIVVLAGLTWSVVLGVGAKGNDVACQARLREIGLALQAYQMEHGKYPGYSGREFLGELYRSHSDLDAAQFICPASDQAVLDDHVERAEAALDGKRGDPVGDEATTYFARLAGTGHESIRKARRKKTPASRIPVVCDGTFLDDDGVTRCSHGDYMHVLFLDGSVKRVQLGTPKADAILKQLGK